MKPAIKVDGLSYGYGRRAVLNDLTFSVPSGAVYGLLGPNGSGKSTTLRLLMGLLRRQGGSVQVLGMDPARDPVGVKGAVGYVAEEQGFYPWMRVDELLAFVAHHRPDWDDAYATRLLDRFSLSPEPRISELSKGQRAMVALLCALAFRPNLLILDEPTASLDPLARRQFLEGVLGEYQEEGGTLLISSHLIHEIAGLVDHVGVVDQGSLITSQTEEMLRATIKRYRLTFADAPPSNLQHASLLRHRLEGRQAVVSLRLETDDDSAVRSWLDGCGASQWVEEPISLEEAFLELLGGPR